MMKFASLMVRRDELEQEIQQAIRQCDCQKVLRLASDYAAVSSDIDRYRSAIARNIAEQLSELKANPTGVAKQ